MEQTNVTSLSLGLLAAAACVFLGTQIKAVSIEKPMLQAQLSFLTQRVSDTEAAIAQADEAIQTREAQIRRAGVAEAKYAALLTELLEIAKTDPDARAVAQKWKIQQTGPDKPADPAPQPAPASAASTDPKGSKQPVQPKFR